MYRPPNSEFPEFIDELEKIIVSLPKASTYLMGDFNLNLHKNDTNPNVEKFEELFLSQGLFPVISLATHYHQSTNSKSCIDNIFTSNLEAINQSGVVIDCGTGHSPIFATSKHNFGLKSNQKEKITQYYDFSRKNTDIFLRKLTESHELLIGNDSDGFPNFTNFNTEFNKLLDETCKLTVPKQTIRNAINNPWITDSLIAVINKKYELYPHIWPVQCLISSHLVYCCKSCYNYPICIDLFGQN